MMKWILNKEYTPLPAYVVQPDPDEDDSSIVTSADEAHPVVASPVDLSSDEAHFSIVTPAGEARPAVDHAVIPRSAERSRRTGDSTPPPKQPVGLAADDGDVGDVGDDGDGAVIPRSAERS